LGKIAAMTIIHWSRIPFKKFIVIQYFFYGTFGKASGRIIVHSETFDFPAFMPKNFAIMVKNHG
jgi:hypothetical protein